MIDRPELIVVLDQHERSFALLRWVNKQLRQGNLDFSVAHENLNFVEAAEEWIRRCCHSFPEVSRPQQEEIPEFASLFTSFLRTSFEPVTGGKRLQTDCGCYCGYCSYLVNVGTHLKARKLGKKAPLKARELKKVYVTELAAERDKQWTGADAEQFIDRQADLNEAIALATYARELVRRTQFASQGEGVYALWREFAWQNGALKRGFRLHADDITEAEQVILKRLTAA